VAELHRRACAWYRAEGDVDDAIAHATAAGDFADACDLIARNFLLLHNLGHFETVARWVDGLPSGAAEADARVCLGRAWTALLRGERVEEVERWLGRAERAPLPGPFYNFIRSVESNAALLRQAAARFAGDVAGSNEAGRRAVLLHPEQTDLGRAYATLGLGMTAYFGGDLTTAGAALREGLRSLPGDGWAGAIVVGRGTLALVQLDQGQLEEAESTVTEAEQQIDELRLDEGSFPALARLARGRLHEVHGDLASAESALSRAVVLARRGGRRLEVAYALIALARLKRRLAAYEDARSLAREARQVVAACPDPGTLGEFLVRTERALQLTTSRRAVVADDPDLSERELAILRLLASELSQREIGSELYVSFNTVKSHTRTIFRKLGVNSRAEAVARGRELGYV
jgi:LuxR family maltose regulon positive regulatory protein